jgi:H+/gluconate symporter-like permease
MAYRKRVTRKAPVRRRRRTMGAAMSAASIKSAVNTTLMGAAGGAAAAVLTNVIGDNLGGFKNYTGLVGALATSVFFKQPVIAAGMAGYAGSKVAAELTGSSLLAEGGMYLPNGSSMYALQGYELLAWLEKISTPAATRSLVTKFLACN